MSTPLFPSEWSKIWIRGTFINLDGSPMAGQVSFAANVTGKTMVASAAKKLIGAKGLSVALDGSGYFQLQIPATNDPDITPLNFTYTVSEPTGRTYPITVPWNTPALSAPSDPLNGQQVIDLTDIVPSPGASGGVGQLLRGVGIQSTTVDGNGHLLVTYTDGRTEDAGFIGSGGSGTVPDATTTVKGKQVLLGGTADAPTVPYGKVTGAPTSLPPSGGAGGVLSGNYPNPAFAVDMATQAELDAVSSAKADTSALTAHTARTDNPHATTKAQVGLGNVDNTSDASKPISTATQSALDGLPFRANNTTTTGAAVGQVVAVTGLASGVPSFGLAAGGGSSYTDEQAQDAVAALIAAGTHSGITFTYDDTGGRMSATVTGGGSGGAASLTPTAPKTAAYTASANEFVPADTTANGFTVTLPSAPADKTRVGVKHVVRGGSNVVTFACAGSDALNRASGPTSGVLTVQGQTVQLQYDAGAGIWYVIAAEVPLAQLDARYAPASLADAVATEASQRAEGDSALGARVSTLEQSGGGGGGGVSSVWLPAARFTTVSGSPNLSTTTAQQRRQQYLYDADAAEASAITQAVPDGWTSFAVDIWWTNAAAGSGDVRFQLDRALDGDTTAMTALPTTVASQTVTAPAQNVLKVTSLGSAAGVTSARLLTLAIWRVATHAADTLPNDVGVLGLMLRKVS